MPLTNDPSAYAQTRFIAGGATESATGSGKRPPGTGSKTMSPTPSSAQAASAVMPPPGQTPGPRKKGPPGMARLGQAPHPAAKPQFSASNPMLGTQPPPAPHPGLSPPYPDARSGNPVLQPNGVPVMPLPKGFPVGSVLHVPPSFAPSVAPQGMTGLLRR